MSRKFDINYKDQELSVSVETGEDQQLTITSGDQSQEIEYQKISDQHYLVIQNGKSYDLRFFHDGDETQIFIDGQVHEAKIIDPIKARRAMVAGGGGVNLDGPVPIESMMPGKIIAVKVKEGDEVKEGQDVVVLEAMKMENALKSPKDGKVTEISVKEGDSVESGVKLLVIE